MSRNSNGTYTLPVGNPVVPGTVISTTWANTTLSDIANALTDSLSRTGDGGMQAPLELTDGSAGAPALTWASETTSGWYRVGAGEFRFSIGGTDEITITASGLTPSALTGSIDGSPTWTGQHTFTSASYPVIASSSFPAYVLNQTTGAVDNRRWDIIATTEQLKIRAVNDAVNVATNLFLVERTGTTIDSVDFPSTAPVRIGGAETPFSSNAKLHVYNAGVSAALFRNTTDNIETHLGSDTTQGYVGTLTNHPFGFYTNNALRVTVAASGEMTGGQIIADRNGGNFVARGTANGASNVAYLTFHSDNGTEMGYVGDANSGNSDIYLVASAASANVRFEAGSGGAIIGTASQMQVNGIHNGTAPTGATNQYIASGTYTPTITNGVNVASSTPLQCQWMRVGNVVTVSGKVVIDPTAAAATAFQMTLPIASNLGLADGQELGGAGVFNYLNAVGFTGDTINNVAHAAFTSSTTAESTVTFTFTYLVV